MCAVSNEALLALEAVRERVEIKMREVTAMWQNPPPPVMMAYGAVVLTSGVLFSALGQWSALGGYVWGGGLLAVVSLTFSGGKLAVLPGSDRKISDIIREVMMIVSLGEESRDEMVNLFLQLLQWNLIESVNLRLDDTQRERLADLLKISSGELQRSGAITGFLNDNKIDSVECKALLEKGVEASIGQMAEVFSGRGYTRVADKVRSMIS